MPDEVQHPDHYNWLPGVECIQVVQHFPFNLGNAIKYIWRSGRKSSSDTLTDLRKAREYIDFEIARVEKESSEDRRPIEAICNECRLNISPAEEHTLTRDHRYHYHCARDRKRRGEDL